MSQGDWLNKSKSLGIVMLAMTVAWGLLVWFGMPPHWHFMLALGISILHIFWFYPITDPIQWPAPHQPVTSFRIRRFWGWVNDTLPLLNYAWLISFVSVSKGFELGMVGLGSLLFLVFANLYCGLVIRRKSMLGHDYFGLDEQALYGLRTGRWERIPATAIAAITQDAAKILIDYQDAQGKRQFWEITRTNAVRSAALGDALLAFKQRHAIRGAVLT